MSKESGKGSTKRPRLISEEEEVLRWKWMWGEYPSMEEWEFDEKIKEIRAKEGGKPKR
jgi:hypothetical protein